jgi:plastocyanin
VNRRLPFALGAVAALAAAAPGYAADHTVTADETNSASPLWAPADLAVQPGDKVTWSFAGTTLPHNLLATSPNWDLNVPLVAPNGPPADRTFATPGIYTYICQLHGTSMTGRIIVGDPPPPPPPPLSEQPFPNDGAVAPAAFETGGLDTTRPALRRVALDRSGRRVTLRFRVSERSEVTVRLARAGKRVRTRRVAAAGRGSVTLRGLRPGRYRIELRARDLAGNASAARVAHVRVD